MNRFVLNTKKNYEKLIKGADNKIKQLKKFAEEKIDEIKKHERKTEENVRKYIENVKKNNNDEHIKSLHENIEKEKKLKDKLGKDMWKEKDVFKLNDLRIRLKDSNDRIKNFRDMIKKDEQNKKNETRYDY